MMFIALVMLPCLKAVKAKDSKPRILADDIFITASGQLHLGTFVYVMDFTHQYIEDMGSKLAPEKSHIMTNDIAAQG